MAAYLGEEDTFDEAMVAFAAGYAETNHHDYERFLDAIADKRLHATPDV